LLHAAFHRRRQGVLRKARPNGDEQAQLRFGRIVPGGINRHFSVAPQDAHRQRIGKNEAALQLLMRRPMNGCAPGGTAGLALLHEGSVSFKGGFVNVPSSKWLPRWKYCIASPMLSLNVLTMRFVQSISAMQRQSRAWQAQRAAVGFVPTMGFLHEGHVSLIKRARRAVGRKGKVVVSLYVNPTQFAPHEDLAAYPRDLARDKKLCAGAGADVLFAPSDGEMYPEDFSTYVTEEKLSQRMEGAARPTHFRGVATILTKLFNIVQPAVAVFGAKDFQQAAVVQKMVIDLNFPLKIIVSPTVRESSGLAMSSRNKYLSPEQRQQAVILWHAITRARKLVQAAGSIPAAQLCKELHRLIITQPQARVDYIEFFDPKTLNYAPKVTRGTQIALAVFVGKTRLIDNAVL
jgi:pantoate--beta-alanine ligase